MQCALLMYSTTSESEPTATGLFGWLSTAKSSGLYSRGRTNSHYSSELNAERTQLSYRVMVVAQYRVMVVAQLGDGRSSVG
jgi:hypothetical protein